VDAIVVIGVKNFVGSEIRLALGSSAQVGKEEAAQRIAFVDKFVDALFLFGCYAYIAVQGYIV
jgi:hypothetical protein